MQILMRWILPALLLGIGIAVLAGWFLKDLPRVGGLRLMIGIVVILFGVYRFAVSRMVKPVERRRYGGERKRPWES